MGISAAATDLRSVPRAARSFDQTKDDTPFARHPGTQRWHFHRDCSSYPAGSRVERQSAAPVTGVMCRECRRHARRIRLAD